MSETLLLVSTNAELTGELETIVKFLGHELDTVRGTRELFQAPLDRAYALAIINTDSSRDMREAISHFAICETFGPAGSIRCNANMNNARNSTPLCIQGMTPEARCCWRRAADLGSIEISTSASKSSAISL